MKVSTKFMPKVIACCALGAMLIAAPTHARQAPYVPALLTGQSNAILLSDYLPPGSHVLVGAWGQSIAAFDWRTRPLGAAATSFLQTLGSYAFGVLIWWQGESDGSMSAAEYANRLQAILAIANRPVMILEIDDHPQRMHIKGVHQAFAVHPSFGQYVALIPTADLPRSGDHVTPQGLAVVTDRLVACYRTACWARQ